ncbi:MULTISPECIES: hypothetical protein [unclassified Pseudofrankia]|uniref:hypothetical protein n=1 Tax=unclassified Pseudofrankia TaxID=2994372 RepID=UPI0012FFAD23|nr:MULTISPECIES: hypothetical protein [unclassified Pseudofrankia]MDT3441540.1 hypothetical protein [Pseudofrankia sp. BMG5.37]
MTPTGDHITDAAPAVTLKVDPAITSTLLSRLGTAAADLDALTAVMNEDEKERR